MNYIFLGLFAVFSAIHLYYSWIHEPKWRARTKPFLLLFLLLYYVTTASPVHIVLVLALFTSWLGDVLLIPKGHKWFTMGGISFLISHILFIAVYVRRIHLPSAEWILVALAGLVYIGISVWVMNSVKANTPKSMVVPMSLYLFTNSAMNLFALLQLMSLKNTGAAVAFAGAVLFFASDCTLFLVRYHDNKNMVFRKHFTVMLTYLLAEFLITFGMILIG